MQTRVPRRLGRRAEGAAGPAFMAVAVAILVMASDVPRPVASEASPDPSARDAELDRAVAGERRQLERLLHLSWAKVGPEELDPELRARQAGNAVEEALRGRFPRLMAGVTLDAEGLQVSVVEGALGHLPGELRVRIHGVVVAWREGTDVRSQAVFLEAADPALPRAGAFLRDLLEEQVSDPRSAVGMALRAALAHALRGGAELPPGQLGRILDDALAGAALEMEEMLEGAPADPAERLDEPLGSVAPETVASNLTAALDQIPPDDFGAYFHFYLESERAKPVAKALLEQLDAPNASLLAAARGLLFSNETPVRNLLARLASAVPDFIEKAAELFREALGRLARALVDAAAEAQGALDALLGSVTEPRHGPPPSFVHLRARDARLSLARVLAPSFLAGGRLLPFEAVYSLSLTLVASIDARPMGPAAAADFAAPLHLEIAAASPGPFPRVAAVARAAVGWVVREAAERFGPITWAMGLAEDARHEADRRLLTFKDAATRELAESSASGFARLALRVLHALQDGDHALAAHALMALMERYFADSLREALTVNFTVLGVTLSLVPDPVRQQVALVHREGPHTFGVRVRRVTLEDNPLQGKYSDSLSLALEIFWSYDKSPVAAALTLDPLARTNDGLVRFDLFVRAGQGLGVSVVAPHIVRRSGTVEATLSQLLPGGIPFAVTPSGGILSLDAGVRVEFGRLGTNTAVQWVIRAVERALLDTLENQTVGEVSGQFRLRPLAQRFLERLLMRAADTFAEDASRIVLRADLFVRVRSSEAAGAFVNALEVGLALREPVMLFREAGSNLARAAHDIAAAAVGGRTPPRGWIDKLPTAVHERIGLEARFSSAATVPGLAYLAAAGRELGAATLDQTLFLSLGALKTLAGGRDLHAISEYAVGWEGISDPPEGLPWRLAAGDGLEAVRLTAQTLVGPRILISEALPAPAGRDSGLEFVELYNPGYAEERLDGWALADASGRSFRLPEGTRIGAGQTLVLARSASAFFERFGAVPDVSTLTLLLNDDGDRLTLLNPFGMASDSVAWGVWSAVPRRPAPDEALFRPASTAAPVSLPGSALRFTGSPLDFSLGPPTPGALPPATA